MTAPRTVAGRALLAVHRERTEWPSTRNDPAAYPDGYLHFCDRCHWERRYPCAVLRAAAAIEAELLADTRERLPALLDHHWLCQGIETGIAYCTCGGWSFDARSGQHPLPVMGERFAPFSEHVALAILAELDGAS
jgi:hypothetical protein